MTDNEIIKELEKWLELFPNSMIKNALALINHQKEELENLKEEIKKVKIDRDLAHEQEALFFATDRRAIKTDAIEAINRFASEIKRYPDDFVHYDFDEFVDEIALSIVGELMRM